MELERTSASIRNHRFFATEKKEHIRWVNPYDVLVMGRRYRYVYVNYCDKNINKIKKDIYL